MKLKHIHTLEKNVRVEKVLELGTPFAIFICNDQMNIAFSETQYPARTETLYWRLDDPIFSLVEVSIDMNTGGLHSIGIPLYNGPLLNLSTPIENNPEKSAVGIPCFDLSYWDAAFDPDIKPYNISVKFYDVLGRCHFEFGERTLRIVLFSDLISYRVITDDTLVTEFNEDRELCAISLKMINQIEEEALKTMIARRGKYRSSF